MNTTLTKDLLIGLAAGLVAVAVMSLRKPENKAPVGVYQAAIDLPKYREMESLLRPPATSAAVQKKLAKRVDTVDLNHVAFDGVLEYLGDLAGVEILAEWNHIAPFVPKNLPIVVDVSGLTIGQALHRVLQVAGGESARFAFQIEGERIRVSTHARLSKELFVRAYDVREIIAGIARTNAQLRNNQDGRPDSSTTLPGSSPPAAAPGATGTDATRIEFLSDSYDINGPRRQKTHMDRLPATPGDSLESLIQFIQKRIDPQSWRGNGGQIIYFAGKLIITQTRPNHDEIALLLQWVKENVK